MRATTEKFARTRASKFQNAQNHFLINLEHVSGHFKHLRNFQILRAARSFLRRAAHIKSGNYVFFTCFGFLTLYSQISIHFQPFGTNSNAVGARQTYKCGNAFAFTYCENIAKSCLSLISYSSLNPR